MATLTELQAPGIGSIADKVARGILGGNLFVQSIETSSGNDRFPEATVTVKAPRFGASFGDAINEAHQEATFAARHVAEALATLKPADKAQLKPKKKKAMKDPNNNPVVIEAAREVVAVQTKLEKLEKKKGESLERLNEANTEATALREQSNAVRAEAQSKIDELRAEIERIKIEVDEKSRDLRGEATKVYGDAQAAHVKDCEVLLEASVEFENAASGLRVARSMAEGDIAIMIGAHLVRVTEDEDGDAVVECIKPTRAAKA